MQSFAKLIVRLGFERERRLFSPGADGGIIRRAFSQRDPGVRKIGQSQENGVSRRFHFGDLLVQCCDAVADIVGTLDEETAALCRRIPLDDLPAERIWGEIEKRLVRAARPSAGFVLALARANLSMQQTLQGLENSADGAPFPTQDAEQTVDALNRLALALLNNAQQIEQGESGTGLQEALEQLTELAESAAQGATTESVVLTGEPSEEIVKLADVRHAGDKRSEIFLLPDLAPGKRQRAQGAAVKSAEE